MKTYQDLLKIADNDQDRVNFVSDVIKDHQTSDDYIVAKIADDYDRGLNTTIMQYQRTITLITGQVVPDKYSATHRCTSNFFKIFTTQLNQYLLGNGVSWNEDHEDKLGKDFDSILQKLGKEALCGAVSFGFYNKDHVEAFSVLQFAPLYDEETGKLRAGVRFWQIAANKPLRATFYEADGYTDYMWSDDDPGDEWTLIYGNAYMRPKKPYTVVITGDAKDREDGTLEIKPGAPYKGFPIIPLYANSHKQSELVGLREKIDTYDFIMNDAANELDNAQIYWIIKGAAGMEDVDLQNFLDRLKVVGAAAPADGQEVDPVTVDIPYNARETLLDRLEKQLYRDAMIFNPDDVAKGATTATQIRAAYMRQDLKADDFEYQVLEFLNELMRIAGIDDDPSFTRGMTLNIPEEVQTVLQAAQTLSPDYVTEKVLTLFGDGDKAEEMIKNMDADELERVTIEE